MKFSNLQIIVRPSNNIKNQWHQHIKHNLQQYMKEESDEEKEGSPISFGDSSSTESYKY